MLCSEGERGREHGQKSAIFVSCADGHLPWSEVLSGASEASPDSPRYRHGYRRFLRTCVPVEAESIPVRPQGTTSDLLIPVLILDCSWFLLLWVYCSVKRKVRSE